VVARQVQAVEPPGGRAEGTEVSVLLTRLYAPSGDFAEPASDWGLRGQPVTERAKLQPLTWARFAGGKALSPSSFGIGADSGHQEHRRPSTIVPTEASGWRSTVRRSIARLVPQPGQKISSHGVPATRAARIVGDHSMSRPVAKRRFQRSMTSSGCAQRDPPSPWRRQP
jgi:hypothetical protein